MVDAQYYNSIFGQNLERLRESIGQTTQIFAVDCGCSPLTIQNYELGRRGPNFKRFISICNTKAISPNRLLAGLFSQNTELKAVYEIQHTLDQLTPTSRQRATAILDTVIKCMIDTSPSLKGADFGTRLHLLRLDSGLDVEYFCTKCMIAKSTYQGYESGQYDPSIPVLLQLCEIVGVSPEYLVAPNLIKTSISDQRLYYLRPRQLKSLSETARLIQTALEK